MDEKLTKLRCMYFISITLFITHYYTIYTLLTSRFWSQVSRIWWRFEEPADSSFKTIDQKPFFFWKIIKWFVSVNYNHTGAPKFWIVIPSPYTKKARKLFGKLFPENYVICAACDLHKRFFVFPQLLTLENIPYHTIRQCPGDYVFTFPEALHMVSNKGFNVAEAINFVTKAWKEKHVDTVAKGTCSHNAELQKFVKIFNCLK